MKENPGTGIPSVERHWENAATTSQSAIMVQSAAIWLPPQETLSKQLTLKNSGLPPLCLEVEKK